MSNSTNHQLRTNLFNATVIVAALGYFVDIFDLVLFGMVRIPSLKSLGINDTETVGLLLDNWQMGGMLFGGIFWGILGDKKGRLTVLFGSIITYSIANIANGMVTDVTWYSIFRFVAGFGLAGELGAGITLVNEIMVKEKRGIATAFVAATGIFGAVAGAIIVGEIGAENWRYAYYVGGGLGLLLLVLRISVTESSIYNLAKKGNVSLGNVAILFKNTKTFKRYISIILVAIPIWYVVQLYAKYSPELGEAIGLEIQDKGAVARISIMLMYLGLTVGDISSGLISNFLKSRLKAIKLFLGFIVASVVLFWFSAHIHLHLFYISIAIIGFAAGYWAVFMSTAAESFGTNIRSTVTNTAPNFVRGSVICINALYIYFSHQLGFGTIYANLLVGLIVMILAIWGLSNLTETFSKDLSYNEQ